uniref:Uncharacterized protein n=1 Tax=Romanomermis culicivorax TaxID=13658 RepID=A0A915J109_ROMCU
MAGQTSSSTGQTVQPKITMTKSAAPPQQMWPAPHSDSHQSHHESHYGDDHPCKATGHSPCRDSATHDSRQHDGRDDAPMHRTQSEQSPQAHSTSFYECEYQHVFRHSPLKLKALKNPWQPEFKALLPLAPSMDVEQAPPHP